MKKIAFFLSMCLSAFSQSPIGLPTAPSKVEFTNIMVNLDNDAQNNVNKEIVTLLTPQNRFLDQKLERLQWYLPIIEEILEQENVPDDLKYICVMESSLLAEAVSSSNAVGFWQFKDATAREVNLAINEEMDDRKNIYFATKGAAAYLKKNNLTLKNWISTIYSFYQGLEGAKKTIPSNWTNANEINFEANTPNYLIKAIAHRIAFEHRLNRLPESPKKLFEYPATNKSLAEISNDLNVDITELKKYNTWLNAPIIPNDRSYIVLAPILKNQSEYIEAKLLKSKGLANKGSFPETRRITEITTSLDSPIYYEINGKKGILAQDAQNLAQMAKFSNLSLKRFLAYNDINKNHFIQNGKIYYLEKKAKKAKIAFHTLAKDQSLWDVSQIYGMKLSRLKSYNKISKNETPNTGRIIWLQTKRPKNTPIEYMNSLIPNDANKEVIVMKTPEKEIKPKSEPMFEPKSKRVLENQTDTPPVNTEILTPRPADVKPVIKDKVVVTKNTDPVNTDELSKNNTKVINNNQSTHKVQAGETLYSIAQKYSLTLAEIRTLNNLNQTDPIGEGQFLLVKKTLTKATEIKTEPVVIQETGNNENIHIVKKGETAYSISKKYGLSVKDLLRLNNLNSPLIEIDQELKIKTTKNTSDKPIANKPDVSSPSINNGNTKTHKVQAGETLFSISKKYGLSVDELKLLNKQSDNVAKLGSILKVSK